MLHRILELVYLQAGENADIDLLLNLLEANTVKVYQIAPAKFGFRPSPLWMVEQAQFSDMLRKTILGLEDVSLGWTPVAFEAKFGIGQVPSLALDLGSEVIFLRGLIDRIDQDEFGNLRVLDYKTGGSHLAMRDLEEGRRLQLTIYALAAQDALKMGKVSEGFYWVIKDAKASSIKLSKCKTEELEGFGAAKHVLIKHLKKYLTAIRSGEFPPKPPSGGCPRYCPAAQWCWRYKSGW
jgi:ATP-dependent helicase/DNAse subunit B